MYSKQSDFYRDWVEPTTIQYYFYFCNDSNETNWVSYARFPHDNICQALLNLLSEMRELKNSSAIVETDTSVYKTYTWPSNLHVLLGNSIKVPYKSMFLHANIALKPWGK